MFETPPDERARRSRGRWVYSSLALTFGLLVVVVVTVFAGSAVRGVTAALGVLVVATIFVWLSPLRPGRHVPLADTANGKPEIVVLWRPGCSYSARLRRETDRRVPGIAWVNIWRDPEAAAVCRRLNGGNEETPTVVVVDRDISHPTVIPATAAEIATANRELADDSNTHRRNDFAA